MYFNLLPFIPSSSEFDFRSHASSHSEKRIRYVVFLHHTFLDFHHDDIDNENRHIGPCLANSGLEPVGYFRFPLNSEFDSLYKFIVGYRLSFIDSLYYPLIFI